MKKNAIFKSMLALFLIVGLASCSKDDNDNNDEATYNTKVYITDSPIDNAEVQGVFVTIADVKVDGKSVDGFTKTTVDLNALQNGDTQLLGDIDLSSKSYNSLTLVLDTDSDVDGNSPANYVLTQNNQKIELSTTNSNIEVNNDFDISSTADNELVIDFDLRKAIVADAGNGGYNFAAEAQLQNSVRVVNTLSTGTIMGTATNSTGNTENVTVAYAYKKGSFSASEENENNDGVRFANAINSSVTSGNNNQFGLYFLQEGNYEIHFASYSDTNNDGVLEFAGMVDAEGAANLDLMNVSVDASTEVTLQVILLEILFL